MVTARHIVVPLLLALASASPAWSEDDLGAMWGTAEAEARYYPIVTIPIPTGVPLRPGGLEVIPEGLAQHINPMGVRCGSPAQRVQDRPKILGLRPLPQDLGSAADFQPVVRTQTSANDGQRFLIHRHSAGLRVILTGQDAPLGDQPEGVNPDQGIPWIG
jgi:hypothetical protein